MVSDLIVTSSSSLVIHLTLVPMRWYATHRGTALVVVAPGVKWKLNLNMEWRRSVCGNSHFHPVLLLWPGTGWVASGASVRPIQLLPGVEMWWAHVTSHWDSINLSIGGCGSFWLLSFRQQTEILCKREQWMDGPCKVQQKSHCMEIQWMSPVSHPLAEIRIFYCVTTTTNKFSSSASPSLVGHWYFQFNPDEMECIGVTSSCSPLMITGRLFWVSPWTESRDRYCTGSRVGRVLLFMGKWEIIVIFSSILFLLVVSLLSALEHSLLRYSHPHHIIW